jgi:hypothetical protein
MQFKAPKVESTQVEETPIHVAPQVVLTAANQYVPSNWSITPGTDTEIEAACIHGGLQFKGSMADFNKLLKGV